MRKLTTTLALTAAIAAATALPAFADHTHVHRVGQDDACVIVAADSGEKDVVLPFATAPKGHPLHVLVHMGQPGEDGDWGVLGKLACSSFVNQH